MLTACERRDRGGQKEDRRRTGWISAGHDAHLSLPQRHLQVLVLVLHIQTDTKQSYRQDSEKITTERLREAAVASGEQKALQPENILKCVKS